MLLERSTDGTDVELANLIRGNDRGAVGVRVLLAASLVAMSAGVGVVAFTSPASAGHGPILSKVTVCHALPGNNPYEALLVDASSVSNLPNGHDSHTGDVIPPYHYLDGKPATLHEYDGHNWPAGAALHANGCNTPTDLTVEKNGPAEARVKSSGAYVLSVVNAGPTAYADITLLDEVPDTWTITSVVPAAGSGFDCGVDDQRVSCTTKTDLPTTAAAASPLKVTVNVVYDSPGKLTNTVRLESAADTDPGNNVASQTTDVVAPDLELRKSGPAKVTVGGSEGYELTVSNSGPIVTDGAITVKDTLPSGVTVTDGLPEACNAVGQLITCSSSRALRAGDPPLVFSIPVTFTRIGPLTNTATVFGGGQVNTDNDTDTADTEVMGIPDLTLTKDGPDSRVVNTGGHYVLTATNSGTGSTTAPVVVVDTLPTAVSAELLPDACEAVGQVVSCTSNGTLAAGASVSFTIPVTFREVGTVRNTADVSGGGQVVHSNDGAAKDTEVSAKAVPDLVLEKAGPDSAAIGDLGTYVLTVGNNGTAASSGDIVVADTLPTGVTPRAPGAGCLAAGQVVTCRTDAVLGVGGTVAFPVPVTFTGVGTVVNEASVEGGGQSNTLNDSAEATTVVAGVPDLTLDKTGPATRTIGDVGSYDLTVTNAGSGPTSGSVTVTDTLPAGVSPRADMPQGCAAAEQLVTCRSSAVLGVNGTVSFTIPVVFDQVGTFLNTAVVSGGGQSVRKNDGAQASTVVAGVPDLRLTKTGPPTATAGDGGNYTLLVENVGSGPATGQLALSDTLPSGVTVSAGSGGGFTCPPAVAGVVTCTSDEDLPAGGARTVVLSATFDSAGVKLNNASVDVDGDRNAANDSSSATTTVEAPAVAPTVTITKANDADRNGSYTLDETVGVAGADVPFKATVTNDSSYALVVSSLDYADSEERLALRAKGSLSAAAADSVTCVPALATIPVGGSADCLFTLPGYSPADGGARRGSVTVVAHQAGNPANATAVSGTSVVRTLLPKQTPPPTTTPTSTPTTPPPTPLPADLSLDKSGPAVASPGDTLTWRLAVLNKGPGAATGFTVTETLPAGVTLTSMSGDGFSCTGASCTSTAILAAGATAVLEVVGRLDNGSTATAVTNTASVTPTDASADNTDTLVTTVTQPSAPDRADLVLDKAGPLEAVKPGEVVTYGISVQNVGTAEASGFVVTDELADGLSLVSVAGAGFTCAGEGVRCRHDGPLAPGATARLVVVTQLAEDYASNGVANTATVALQDDPTPDNNTDTATTAVTLPIGGVGDPDPGTGGEQPTPEPEQTPSTLPFTDDEDDEFTGGGGGTEQEQTPRTLPFTGAPAGLLLALGAGLSSLGLMLALAGRRRRSTF